MTREGKDFHISEAIVHTIPGSPFARGAGPSRNRATARGAAANSRMSRNPFGARGLRTV